MIQKNLRVSLLYIVYILNIYIYILKMLLLHFMFMYIIFLDVLPLKSESWNELEEQEELSNNIPNQKLSHMEKANLLR